MTLNFEDFWTLMQTIGLLILVITFAVLATTQALRAKMWKDRCTETAIERDGYAEKYFETSRQLVKLQTKNRLAVLTSPNPDGKL